LSNKFTRMQNFVHRTSDDVALPMSLAAHIGGENVAVGEPVQIHGVADFRRDVESSLEVLAKTCLLDAEAQAQAIVAKSETMASQLLEKSNAQARAMLEQAQSEVDAIRAAAHEAGFKSGFQEGYADSTEQVETETVELLKSAQLMVDSAYQLEKRVLKDFEPHTLSLIAHVIRKILGREMADTPDLVLDLVRRAVESLYISGKVKVVLNPHVLHELRRFSAASQEALDAMSRFEFVADPVLDLYQFFIIGQEGSFDVSPENQIAQLLAPVEKHLKLPRPDVALNAADSFDSIPAPDMEPDAQLPDMTDLMTSEADNPGDETREIRDTDGAAE
jgi:flagellar assembly protein FliH